MLIKIAVVVVLVLVVQVQRRLLQEVTPCLVCCPLQDPHGGCSAVKDQTWSLSGEAVTHSLSHSLQQRLKMYV